MGSFHQSMAGNCEIIETSMPSYLKLGTLRLATCTCTPFFKKNICKHIIAIA